MPRVQMVRSPMEPADYADHVGLWSVGTVYELTDDDWKRKQADHPGCFALDVPEPLSRPPRAAVVKAPERHTETKTPPRARRKR